MNNLTQFGDAFVLLSLLTMLLYYLPMVWSALINASLISLVFSFILKNIFSMPRPAVMYHDFIINGPVLTGNNSLPSGHTITIFTTLTVLLFAFMPTKLYRRCLWCTILLALGAFIALSRVGVGAHYPLDVVFGALVGYLAGVSGILIDKKYALFRWVAHKNIYPLFVFIFFTACILLILKIVNTNLSIYYLSLASLIFSILRFTDIYVRE
ncbi:phosphatase PAP2 family protein [Pelobium manganitolerans]|uniref:phosphatase PAP2 family protein n=1 Tax=Pelobium manganitolerans TaxID=1842495 RepID=UPI003FA3A0E7